MQILETFPIYNSYEMNDFIFNDITNSVQLMDTVE